MKKIVSLLCIVSLIFSASIYAYAISSGGDYVGKSQYDTPNVVSRAVDFYEESQLLTSTGNFCDAELNGSRVSIPYDIKNPIELKLDSGEVISMKLPEVLKCKEGYNISNRAIVYDSKEGYTSVMSYPTLDNMGDNVIESGVRTCIVIRDIRAPHDYSFEFNLPKGYKFLTGKEVKAYGLEMDEIAIVRDGFLIGNIKSPWAKDKNGKNLKTSFTLKDSVLNQHVEFDENTSFPVVIDPWYGNSIKTEDYGALITKKFSGYPAGQGEEGFGFKGKGSILYTDGSNVTVSVNVSLGANLGYVPVSAGIGIASQKAGTSGIYDVENPPGTFKLKITKRYKIQRYKIYRKWLDPKTHKVKWKLYSRGARKETFLGINGEVIRTGNYHG